MKSPGLFSGILLSVGACAMALPILTIMMPLLGWYFGFKILMVALLALYTIYLVSNSKGKAGIVLFLFLSGLLTVGAVLLPISLLVIAGLCVMVIWMARSILFQKNLMGSVCDLILCFVGLSLAWISYTATRSHIMAIWTFFLVQALFVLIPSLSPFGPSEAVVESDSFSKAHQVAEEAFARIVNK